MLLALLSVNLYLWRALDWQRAQFREELLNAVAADVAQALEEGLQQRVETIVRLGERWRIRAAPVAKAEWELEAQLYLRDFPSIHAFAWVDPDYTVRWWMGRAKNSLAGRDLSDYPDRAETLHTARQQDRPLLTPPLHLLSGAQGYLIAVPVRVGDEFVGFLVASMHFSVLFERILYKAVPGFAVEVLDRGHSLYRQTDASEASAVLYQKSQKLALYGREWEVRIRPIGRMLAAFDSRLPELVLGAGVVASLMTAFALYLAGLARRQSLGLAQLNAELREARQRTEAILSSIADPFFSLDRHWRIVHCNRRAEELLAAGGGSPLGRRFHEALPVWVDSPLERCLQEALATRAPQRCELYQEQAGCWLAFHAYPYGEGVSVYGRDVTSRRRHTAQLQGLSRAAVAINKLQDRGHLLQLLADEARAVIGTHQAMMVFIRDGDPSQAIGAVSLSDKYAAWRDYDVAGAGDTFLLCGESPVLRLTQAELEAHPRWPDFARKVARQPPLRGWLAVSLRDAAGRRLGLLQLSDKYDGEFTVEDEAIALQFAAMAAAVLDNIHLYENVVQALDSLQASNKELQDFAFVASHDLQEPLRKIQAFADRLQERAGASLDEQSRDYLARMNHAARRMQTLIDDLLLYSRVTTKARPFEVVALSRVVREVLVDLEALIEQSGADIEVLDLPTLKADPTQMRQLFQNLLGNALKFRRPGVPPRIRVWAESGGEGDERGSSRERSLCRVCVQDNGIGFDEKYLHRIFIPFQRLHGRAQYEGNGIGLAIVKKIVERHGGSVTARSQPGVGATFIVTLPGQQTGDAPAGHDASAGRSCRNDLVL
ncbi:MAG TPA: ATP-binding protein [Candidatus Competibacteraceae bacterium]|nr:ATP-binding protein [Candidatus Competibacteraceae bacterium]